MFDFRPLTAMKFKEHSIMDALFFVFFRSLVQAKDRTVFL